MKNITNAYLVLSVADLKALLRAAELEQQTREDIRESVTVVLENITVLCEGEEYPQIGAWSVVAAANASAKLSLDDIAAQQKARAEALQRPEEII